MFVCRLWENLENLIKNIDPNLKADLKFVFYSAHTVCLPTFFPNPKSDMAWAFSLVLILLNFIAFCLIAIGYGPKTHAKLNNTQLLLIASLVTPPAMDAQDPPTLSA